MVEFGLKLEDNKVADWADKYIDYEKLKVYLKKAKKAAQARDVLEKRRPELAAEVRAAYDAGVPSSSIKAKASMSEPSLSKLSSGDITVERTDGGDKAAESVLLHKSSSNIGRIIKSSVTGGEMEEEMVPLVDEKEKRKKFDKGKYGSGSRQDSFKSVTPTGSVASDLASLARSESNVSLFGTITGYFQRGSYASKLTETYKIVDEQLELFSGCLLKEFDKVKTFHGEKIDDLEKRLEVLIESVGSNYDVISQPKEHGGEEGTFLRLKDAVNRKVKSIMAKTHGGGAEKPRMHHTFAYESDDEVSGPGRRGSTDLQSVLRESDSIKRALIDLHRTTTMCNNFAIMNYTGFVKIIKKFNKTFPERKGEFEDVLKDAEYIEGNLSEQLANRMEKLFADWFCDGNVREARAKMLPKRGDGLQMDWSQLRLGYRLGMCSILTLWVCWDCIWGLVSEGHSSIGGRTAFPVFRACGGLLLVHWFWGISVYVWTRYRINYIFLFDFNPRIVDTPMLIFNDVVDETLVFLILMLLYYKSGSHDMPDLIPPGCYPFALVLYAVKCLVFPIRTRAPLWVTIWAVVTAPLTSPKFFQTYVADVFTSMVKVFQDVLWTMCFVLSGDFWVSENENSDVEPHKWQHEFWYKNVVIPLICLFPLWIRFNQCLRRYMDTGKRMPHLANAGKYAMSQTVTLFGAFHPIYLLHSHKEHHSYVVDRSDINLFQLFWMGIFFASSMYSFAWDIYMDWGLGRPAYAFLGPRLMFPNKYHYYGVMAADLVLRFMWVQSLIPPQSGASFELPSYLTAMTMSLELLRRTLWGFFRLEHEHRHNTEGYRRVDFVPLHFNTGHDHKYKKEKEHVGVTVLAEVFVISAVVIVISLLSIMAAQKATVRVAGADGGL